MLLLENTFTALESMPEDSVKEIKPKKKINPELDKLAQKFDDEFSDEEDTFEIEFAMFKRDYYMQKLGYVEVNR